VAAVLNAEGFVPPRRVTRFSGGMVGGLLARQASSSGKSPGARRRPALRRGESLLGDLARQLGMPTATLHHWRKAGWVRSRKLEAPDGRWVIWASGRERQRLTRLRRHQQSQPNQAIPKELTTPERPSRK
jgi:hypothetical protein